MRRSFNHNQQRGFTLIEMLVVAPIIILAIGAFLTVIISMTGEVIASRATNSTIYDLQDALLRVEQDVQRSNRFLATNNVTLSAPNAQGYNDDATAFTNVGGASGTSLILMMTATTGNPLDIASEPVARINQPNACNDAADNTRVSYNVVYFIKDDTLWRRVIMPADYADTVTYSCSLPWQRPSCSQTYMDAQTGSVFCKTNDTKLVEGITTSDFEISYFTNTSDTTPNSTASDTGSSTTARNTALATTSTVEVSLTSNTTAAGRDISESATTRTSRLDPFAIAPNTPATPTVSSSVLAGAQANFSWPAISGATGYTVEYNIDGGSWQTGFTNLNTLSYTVTAPYNGVTVNARVVALNSEGSSGYGTDSENIPVWQNVSYQNNWSDYSGSYAGAQYSKTSSGVIILRGLMKRSGSVVANETIATLPSGFRPQYSLGFLVAGATATGNARLTINSSGNILATAANATLTGLDRIAFIPSGTGYTWNNIASLSNGWTNSAVGTESPARYTIDSAGRVHFQGAVVPGTTTSGTTILPLPSATQISRKLIMPVMSANGFYSLDVGQTALVTRGNNPGTKLHTNATYFPTAYSGWTAMTLSNSWVVFDSNNSSPEYTKTSDNVVTLKGLIRSGTTTSGTTLTTLPAGYRPNALLSFVSVCNNNATCRIEVDASGVVRGYGLNATWSSLNGINFIADQ